MSSLVSCIFGAKGINARPIPATTKPMIDLIATTAQREHVGLFHRFAIMRHWHQVAGIPFDTFLSADQLHMNDWSYGCIAKLLASSIADLASRSTLISRH